MLIIRVIIVVLSIILSKQTVAQDAIGCVFLGSKMDKIWDKEGHTLTNKCGTEVVIFWCIDYKLEKEKQKMCGGNKYYKKMAVLDSGETQEGYYKHPKKYPIRFGACLGASRKLVKPTNTRNYTCDTFIEDVQN